MIVSAHFHMEAATMKKAKAIKGRHTIVEIFLIMILRFIGLF